MTKRVEVRKRGTGIPKQSTEAKVKTPKVVPLPAEKPADQPQTLGAFNRIETAAHRKRMLGKNGKAKIQDARLAEAKKKGLLPNV